MPAQRRSRVIKEPKVLRLFEFVSALLRQYHRRGMRLAERNVFTSKRVGKRLRAGKRRQERLEIRKIHLACRPVPEICHRLPHFPPRWGMLVEFLQRSFALPPASSWAISMLQAFQVLCHANFTFPWFGG